ncbi:hypothetical protein ACHAP3_001127 [Botrytis cinerea]
MHIWAGSGSVNGKETVRRRERTPIKTGKILKKRKSSAKIGLGLDGSCFTENIAKSSPGPDPSPSPRRDSGIDSVMASESGSDESIITVINIPTYDVEEDMVKPLNVGSLDSDGSLIAIGKTVSDLEMPRGEKMNKNLQDEWEYSPTLGKGKVKYIASMDMDGSNGEDADDFSSSFGGLSRMMASNHRMFRTSSEKEDRVKDLDNNVFAKKESVGTRHSVPTDLPSSTIDVTPAEDTQNDWHESASVGKENEPDSYVTSTASCIDTDSSKSEHKLERIFSVDSVYTSEPKIPDGCLSYEISTTTNKSDYEDKNENKSAYLFDVGCVRDSKTKKEDKYLDIKFTSEIDIDVKPEEEKEPEKKAKTPHVQLWDEISRCVDKALDVSQEIRRKESIRGFSLKVPHLVLEAKQGLCRSPSPSRSCKSSEMVGEMGSLKEREFCVSGFDDCGMGEGGLMTSIEGLSEDCWAHMQGRDDCVIVSMEGVSSNLGSSKSLSVMGRGERNCAEVGREKGESVSCVGVGVGVDEENFTLSDSPCRQLKIDISGDEIDGDSSNHKETRQDSVERENERDIANSERFSPVHQTVIQLMTPKHGRYHTIREKGGKAPASYRMFESQINGKTVSRELGSIAMERKASQYPAKDRAFSQPCWSKDLNWFHQCSSGSLRAGNLKDSDGDGSEEWLLGNEKCSEIEEEMERFWKVNSAGPMARFGKMMMKMDRDTETEIEIEGDERNHLPVMNRKGKMKMADVGSWELMTDENGRVSMGSSQVKFREVPTIIRRSMPQLDGPVSPPLLAVEAPAGSTHSPSPRKRLQKVNRSKSPSLLKSSSSSLGKVFQSSRVEGMEGEIRDLRREVEDLRNMVGRLERELKGVVDFGGEDVGQARRRLGDRVKDVWSVVYGKDWEGEKVGQGGEDRKSPEEMEWLREVREVGLMKIVERMKRERDMEEIMHAVDEFLKENQVESLEKNLMVSSSTNPEFGDRDISASKISMEKEASRESLISGCLKINESCTAIQEREIGGLSADEMGLKQEITTLDRQRCDLRDYKSGRRDGGMIGRESKFMDSEVKDCELISEVPLLAGWIRVRDEGQSGGGDECSLDVQKSSELTSLENREEMEREEMKKMGESLRLDEMDVEGRIDAEIPGEEGKEMETSVFAKLRGSFDVSVKGNGNGKGVVVEGEVEAEGKRVEYLVQDLLTKQEGERRKREEWWERERKGDKMEIQRLGGVVEELRELVLRGVEMGKGKGKGGVCAGERKGLEQDEDEHEHEIHDCDKPGCWCRPSGSGSGTKLGGRKIGKKHECGASNVANMRERDVYGDGDEEWDSEERRIGNENGKGFWDWVGGGILWRQD